MNECISVIVPIYKVEPYLDKCIGSIVNQTYKNLDIILVDDGSPDRCPEIADLWGKKDSRIRVIHKNNAGLGAARNTGLDVAIGNYIIFVDSDDYLTKQSIEVLYNQISLDKSDLVIGGYIKEYSDGRPNESSLSWDQSVLMTSDEVMKKIHTDSEVLHVCACAKLYRRDIFNNLRFPLLRFAEDINLWPRVIKECRTISVIPDKVYYYYQRSTSLVHSKNDELYFDGLRSSLDLANYFYDLKMFEEAYFYYRWSIMKTLQIDNKKNARKIICENFSKDKLSRIKPLDLKAKIVYLGLFFSVIHKVYWLIKKHK